MIATLFLPGQMPLALTDVVAPVISSGGFVQVPGQVADLLGCPLAMVDILDSGMNYVIFTIFDSEDAVNTPAMEAVSRLSGNWFSTGEEDEMLRGPVLVISGL